MSIKKEINNMISNFKKIIKKYSIDDKKLLLEKYQNNFNILSELYESPFVDICSNLNVPNTEYKFNKSNKVILN